MRNKKLILIDLDGVLNDYCGQFNENHIPRIKFGAKTFLKNLSREFNLKIFTVRDNNQVLLWLDNNNIKKYVIGVTNIKEPAYLYIDDRCICFNGDFKDIVNKIKSFNVYWNC